MPKRKQENEFALFIMFLIIGIIFNLYKKILGFYNNHPVLLITLGVVVLGIIVIIIQYIFNKKRNRWLSIDKIEDMHKLHWREFEKFIEFVLQEKGFKTKIGPGIKDGGVDLYASLNGRKYLIQCKKWTNYKVSESNIREFYGAMNDFDNNAKGIFITTSNLTSDAKNFAERNGIEIWDEFLLEKYVREYTSGNESKESKLIENNQICDKCGGKLIERKAKFGTNKGNIFFGCENYPKCKNIVNI
ncbi:restriction endonuclease [Candidatus Gracilibacteria bacterium]|nr:restriction endonuclease [Candidatus Gracilibacteria bacterium]